MESGEAKFWKCKPWKRSRENYVGKQKVLQHSLPSDPSLWHNTLVCFWCALFWIAKIHLAEFLHVKNQNIVFLKKKKAIIFITKNIFASPYPVWLPFRSSCQPVILIRSVFLIINNIDRKGWPGHFNCNLIVSHVWVRLKPMLSLLLYILRFLHCNAFEESIKYDSIK